MAYWCSSGTKVIRGSSMPQSSSGYSFGLDINVGSLSDPNRYELFKGQWAATKAAGQPYQELAHVKVIDTRGKMAIAQIEYSCDSIVPGDYAIPFVEKNPVAFHKPIRFDRFEPSTGNVAGRIFLTKDFDEWDSVVA